jgi:hypothetical protein
MTKSERRHIATNKVVTELSREFWPHVDHTVVTQCDWLITWCLLNAVRRAHGLEPLLYGDPRGVCKEIVR